MPTNQRAQAKEEVTQVGTRFPSETCLQQFQQDCLTLLNNGHLS